MSKASTTIHPDKRHNSPDITQPVYQGILYGVGVGPGSPDLVTLRAVNVLKSVSHIIAPTVDEQSPGKAEIIIRSIIPGIDVERFVFPVLNEDTSEHNGVTQETGRTNGDNAANGDILRENSRPYRDIDSIYGKLVDRIALYTEKDESVAFITLGDPDIYSTFSHVRHLYTERYPHLPLETIPGICAFQELAARTNTTLCIGSDALTLTSHLHAGNDHSDILSRPDSTAVIYKGGDQVTNIAELANRSGKIDSAVVGIHLGQEGEKITPLKEIKSTRHIPYLSTIIMPCREY